MMSKFRYYPVIDLFAGPGGLGEGFASLQQGHLPTFKSLAAIEQNIHAYQTLLLRHFFRAFPHGEVPKDYYSYLAGKISREELENRYPNEWNEARSTAICLSLGEDNHEHVRELLTQKLKGHKKWALVGGPPCQAYSLVGRSRRANDPNFENDEKHFLYREYLKIIIDHRPPVFVMENVKGLLSAKVNGVPVIEKILGDLAQPKEALTKEENGLSYKLFSLNESSAHGESISAKSFVVKAEEYGVPQARHRMFILGIRSDIDVVPDRLSKSTPPIVKDLLDGMPKIRSGISKGGDSTEKWTRIIKEASQKIPYPLNKNLPKKMSSGRYFPPKGLPDWFFDKNLEKITGHESRSHMESDLYRYFFVASYAKKYGTSPKLADFPKELLPKHKNVKEGCSGKMFSDRFRVQLPHTQATTITSHISKDGHYYIHYDPSQCRSLTVREAARLQTFPDNYHFEGPRTEQYHQVGNAVPPYLAMQIGKVVAGVLDRMEDDVHGD